MKEFLTNVRLAILFMHPGVRDFALKLACREVGTGLSSRALAIYALGLQEHPYDHQLQQGPYDQGDYMRCIEVYNDAPKILQRKMKPILDEWQERVQRRWPSAYVPEASDPHPKVFGRWS